MPCAADGLDEEAFSGLAEGLLENASNAGFVARLRPYLDPVRV